MTSNLLAFQHPDGRRGFVRQRVRAGAPWTIAATELLVLLEWRGGLSGAALAWHAAACLVTLPLVYLPMVIALARLEWRYSLFVDRPLR